MKRFYIITGLIALVVAMGSALAINLPVKNSMKNVEEAVLGASYSGGGGGNLNKNTTTAKHLIPAADNTYDLGSQDASWKDLWVDGSAYIDTVVVSTTVSGTTTFKGGIVMTDPASADTVTIYRDGSHSYYDNSDTGRHIFDRQIDGQDGIRVKTATGLSWEGTLNSRGGFEYNNDEGIYANVGAADGFGNHSWAFISGNYFNKNFDLNPGFDNPTISIFGDMDPDVDNTMYGRMSYSTTTDTFNIGSGGDKIQISASGGTTSTVIFGEVGKPYCKVLRDSDDDGWSYETALDGVKTISQTPCDGS